MSTVFVAPCLAARIVSLGESTHGSREMFRLKHRLIEWLVTELGLGVVCFETGLPEAMPIDSYVLGGEGDPGIRGRDRG